MTPRELRMALFISKDVLETLESASNALTLTRECQFSPKLRELAAASDVTEKELHQTLLKTKQKIWKVSEKIFSKDGPVGDLTEEEADEIRKAAAELEV